jgi:serine protease Do
MSNTFSQIAKQLEPSVVNINTESTIKNVHKRRGSGQDESGGGGGGMDDFFNHFFGGPGGRGRVKALAMEPSASVLWVPE